MRFRRADRLRAKADYHERKASTPELIFKVCSERFSKINFGAQTPANILYEHVLPRRKGWGKPISAAKLRKLKKTRDQIRERDLDARKRNFETREIETIPCILVD